MQTPLQEKFYVAAVWTVYDFHIATHVQLPLYLGNHANWWIKFLRSPMRLNQTRKVSAFLDDILLEKKNHNIALQFWNHKVVECSMGSFYTQKILEVNLVSCLQTN